MLPGRRSGYVIMILGSVLGLVIPVVHMKGAGVGAALVQSDGGFFFVWTLLALGAGAAFTLVLAARGLWGLRRGAPPGSKGLPACDPRPGSWGMYPGGEPPTLAWASRRGFVFSLGLT